MDKSDAPSSRPAAGRLVDETVSCGAAGLEGRIEVGDSIAHVMDAGTATLEELCDRGARLAGSQQLDVSIPELQGDDPGPVDILSRTRLEAEHGTIEREGLVEVGDGDPDVSQPRI